ncbi:MAG TPA: DUF3943 domain-containing protein [Burkholderiales bacterium]|nr:DUF3943 domain-containing protein [Burkholderiales bacterium]
MKSCAFLIFLAYCVSALALENDPDKDKAPPRDYAIPALEIAGFEYLLNRYDHRRYGEDYASNWTTVKRNLRSSWVVDRDPFNINQLGHPYQGSMYYGFARSAGLNYWESLFYSFAGSAAWEIAGETTLPSKNDQIASGIGGSFLGEALYRMANLALEKSDKLPRFWREAGAAAISPATGFNRLAFGERFRTVLNSHDPVYYSRLSLALSGTVQNRQGNSTELKRGEALADFALDYGLPGKPGYTYSRPFDYFSFQGTASSANGVENLMTRGLLLGTDYDIGQKYRGVWGLYGSYDYISPQIFRVSTTALSLGTTGQYSFTPAVALQGSAMAGAGYAAVGTVHSSGERDYHYGVAPQALLGLRLILGAAAAIDFTTREYFVSNVSAGTTGGHDNIIRTDLTLTLRIHKQHAIAIKYLWNRRDASFTGRDDLSQARGTVGIYYTLLGHDRFGAVDWQTSAQ